MESFTEGELISFDAILGYDGHVKLFESINGIQTLIGYADIGSNILTADNQTYPISAQNGSNINGILLFEERVNGEAVVTVDLEGLDSQSVYEAIIYSGAVESTEEESAVLVLNPFDGQTGVSWTNVAPIEGFEMDYNTLVSLDGHLKVILIQEDLLVASGNIGINAE